MTEQTKTESEREKIYDEEIAPELLRIARRCEELGISFCSRSRMGNRKHGANDSTSTECRS